MKTTTNLSKYSMNTLSQSCKMTAAATARAAMTWVAMTVRTAAATTVMIAMTPSRIIWYKCLGEEYDFGVKVVLRALEVIKQITGMLDVVERHRHVLQARQRR
jgi:hypothetical protein